MFISKIDICINSFWGGFLVSNFNKSDYNYFNFIEMNQNEQNNSRKRNLNKVNQTKKWLYLYTWRWMFNRFNLCLIDKLMLFTYIITLIIFSQFPEDIADFYFNRQMKKLLEHFFLFLSLKYFSKMRHFQLVSNE